MQTPLHHPRPAGPRASAALRTPEPSVDELTAAPSRPPRLRLKRRAVSHLAAPTQQFLASVAAADVPIPSIEEPQLFDDEMLEPAALPINSFDDGAFPDQPTRGRALSSPKTPAPRSIPSLSPKRFPDWTIDASLSSLESSPDCESSRPSTARSTQTSASSFSRFSLASDDIISQCASPEESHTDRFVPFLPVEDADKTIKGLARPPALRKAPWTRAMSRHLWSTYTMYLQDPKVTPFRIGKSGIPPSGVCLRVAREAKRSWKGSRVLAAADVESGSTTPRAESSAPYIQWPHTCAATRAHLRELCKVNSATAARNVRYMAHSPTPFGKAATRHWSRRSVPPRSPSVFSGSDMAMSLTVCTADSMQPQGPLARLAGPPPEAASEDGRSCPVISVSDPSPAQGRLRLGSPFLAAKSYGPSSSGTSLANCLGLTEQAQRQSRTVGERRSLGSPVRLNNARGSTQKRRSRQPAVEPRRSKRPSLGSDFWTDPSLADDSHRSSAAPFAEFCSTSSNVRDKLFVPRTNVQELFEASGPSALPAEAAPMSSDKTLAPPMAPPARLGSPFHAKSTSFSFPSRCPHPAFVVDAAAGRRPFATVHQPSDGAAGAAKATLASRLAYIDGRLKDFRRQEAPARRSHSPF